MEKIKFQRHKTPTLIQMEATECGAVALGIILGYYGCYIPIEELRTACGVTRNGSNAYKMVEAAKSYGLDAKGYSGSLENLYSVKLPCILFWKFDHFVVLEGFGKDCVYINDPSTGPRTISYDDLDQAFTGVVLVFEPTPQFVRKGKPPNFLEFLWPIVIKSKSAIIFAALLGVALVIPNLALAAISQIFVDQIFITKNLQWQSGILIGLGIAVVATTVITFLQTSTLNLLRSKISIQLGSNTLWHMLRLPMSFYTQRFPGEVASRLALNESVSNTIAGNLAQNIINLVFAVLYGIVIFYYDIYIALTSFAMIALNLFLMQLIYRSREDAYARFRADYGRVVALSLGALQNIEAIKASAMELKFFSRWSGYYTKVITVLQDVGKKDIFIYVVSPTLQYLTTFVFIAIGIWRVLNGHLTIGMFLALQILLKNFTQPIQQLVAFMQSLQFLKIDIGRLNDLMQYKQDPIYCRSARTNDSFEKLTTLSANNISFGYSPVSPAIISNFSFSLHPGDCTGLMGPTGSGKSTIARVVAGLYTPWSGQVSLDNLPFEEIPRKQIISSLAYVEQESFFFKGTVRENLTLLDPTVPEEDLIRAAQDACIHDVIINRNEGYDQEIEEEGKNFSSGQKQRLEIARALAKNPSIIILDEACSALDSLTEEKIIDNISRRGCAILLITHRTSTAKKCCKEIINI